jgi:penicillin-binding protein 1A
LPEAAMLAGLFKAPSRYAPHANPEAARARANVVLYRMLDTGFITQGELLQARREPAVFVPQNNPNSPDWFLDWAYKDTIALLEKRHISGDFVIEVKTTIDMKLQTAAQQIINETIDTEGPQYHITQGAAVTMTPDGAVKAIVGGRDYENSQFNRATDAERQPGSSFKPFVYLAALLNGYKPSDIVVDGPVWVGGWSPRNYSEKYAGRTTLINALAHSYNSVPVRLMIDIGRRSIIDTAHKVGITGELETWPPMVLGTSALTLLDLTTGYATFAANGKLARPYTVLEMRRANGDIIYSREVNGDGPAPQAVPEEKIAELNSMLSAVVKRGTGRRADLGFAPQGGKTGTNQSYRDAWYIGFTAHNVTGVWVGNDDFTEMNKVTGGLIPAPAWKKIMLVAEADQKPDGLAGIPLDGSYVQMAAATEQEVGPAGEENSSIAIEGALPDPGSQDGVTLVLNDMFSLFKEEPKAKKKSKPRAASQQSLILPKANTGDEETKSFLDEIFGSSDNGDKPRKKKKKKPLFSF